MTATIYCGDARETLAQLPDGSVQACVTSPPYFGLRDYGVDGQIGLEATVDDYVQNLVAVFREVRRVLADEGVAWINLGDSYAGGGRGGHSDGLNGSAPQGNGNAYPRSVTPDGLKPKDLIGIPWRVAFALQADGWYLRQDIIWHKPNPMPESVKDRCTKSHEYIFLLSKSPRYDYNAEAIAEPAQGAPGTVRSDQLRAMNATPLYQSNRGGRTQEPVKQGAMGVPDNGMRNRRSVWTIATQPFSEAHFATFPPKLIEPCILAGSREGDTVLDPFTGSGTTGMVANRHNRNFIGIELNPEYAEMARRRITNDAPMFNRVEVLA